MAHQWEHQADERSIEWAFRVAHKLAALHGLLEDTTLPAVGDIEDDLRVLGADTLSAAVQNLYARLVPIWRDALELHREFHAAADGLMPLPPPPVGTDQ